MRERTLRECVLSFRERRHCRERRGEEGPVSVRKDGDDRVVPCYVRTSRIRLVLPYATGLEGSPRGDPLHLHTVRGNRLPEAEWRGQGLMGCGTISSSDRKKRMDARGSGACWTRSVYAASLVSGYCRSMSRLHSVSGNRPLNCPKQTYALGKTESAGYGFLARRREFESRVYAGEEECLAGHSSCGNRIFDNP